ncbi:MAG: AcvB/VirJ family lysyl-phosphatidylglycerol hydrolase [Pelobium sp.]
MIILTIIQQRKLKTFGIIFNAQKSLNPNRISILILVSFCLLIGFSGCSLIGKNRVSKHKGIENSDFDLPLFFYPSKTESSKPLVLFLSGDGGWVNFDDELAIKLAADGFNTIGLSSRSYFWRKRKPEEIAKDLALLLLKYTREYESKKIILLGYSFGADVIPFVFNRLPFFLKNNVECLVLLSPYASTDFLVHTADLINFGSDDREYKVGREVEKVRIPVYCFYGRDEKIKALGNVKNKRFVLKILPGDHRYTEQLYEEINQNFKGNINWFY